MIVVIIIVVALVIVMVIGYHGVGNDCGFSVGKWGVVLACCPYNG